MLHGHRLHRIVLAELEAFLRSPQRLIELLGVDAEEKRGLLRSVTDIPCSAEDLLTKAVKKVVVRETAIEIKISEDQLRRAIGFRALEDGTVDTIVTLEILGRLQRSAKGESFVLPPDHASGVPRHVPALVQAVAGK